MYRLPSRRGSSPVRRLPPRRRNGSHCGRGDGSPGSLRVRSDDHPSAERPAHQSCTTARAATCTGSLAPWRRERRRRHVAELNQELRISAKQYWGRHRSEIKHEPDGAARGHRVGRRHRRWDADPVPQRLGAAEAVPRTSASTRSSTLARTLPACPSPRHTGGPAWCAASFARRPKRAPKPSSCSQLPDDPASARATRRSD